MLSLLLAISFTGLLIIFIGAYKRIIKSEKSRLSSGMIGHSVDRREPSLANQTMAPQRTFKSSLDWKRPNLDFKELNNLFNQADLNLSKGFVTEAEQGFIKVLAIKPDHEEANNKLGVLYLKTGQHKKAEEIYRLLTEIYPEKAVYFSNLGLSYYNQRKLKESARAYENAIWLDSKRPERFISLGQVYRELEEFTKSSSAFGKALELNSKNEDLYFVIADVLNEIRAYPEAIAYMKALLELSPYNDRAKFLITDFQRKMKLSPLSSEQKHQMANARFKQKTLFNDIGVGEAIPQTINAEDLPVDAAIDQTNVKPDGTQLRLDS
ncbi:tetratricopeptide repeat protein [Candidatus Gracilibacteria bacterium]|jgi:tetratricopeptide (TPR) repeat protein|nr:tetratricopeptide repeat protein [Candidatus Gracilibacteria bacterium]